MSGDRPGQSRDPELLDLPPQDRATMVESMPHQLVVPLDADRTDEVQAAELIGLMQQERFDLRRKVFLAFVIDFDQRRDSAYQAAGAVAQTAWESTLYGDTSGWVVRLARTRRVSMVVLLEDLSEVKQLAERTRGRVRGLALEDLRAQDRWLEMASDLSERRLRPEDAVGPSVPHPRLSSEMGLAVGDEVTGRRLTP